MLQHQCARRRRMPLGTNLGASLEGGNNLFSTPSRHRLFKVELSTLLTLDTDLSITNLCNNVQLDAKKIRI